MLFGEIKIEVGIFVLLMVDFWYEEWLELGEVVRVGMVEVEFFGGNEWDVFIRLELLFSEIDCSCMDDFVIDIGIGMFIIEIDVWVVIWVLLLDVRVILFNWDDVVVGNFIIVDFILIILLILIKDCGVMILELVRDGKCIFEEDEIVILFLVDCDELLVFRSVWLVIGEDSIIEFVWLECKVVEVIVVVIEWFSVREDKDWLFDVVKLIFLVVCFFLCFLLGSIDVEVFKIVDDDDKNCFLVEDVFFISEIGNEVGIWVVLLDVRVILFCLSDVVVWNIINFDFILIILLLILIKDCGVLRLVLVWDGIGIFEVDGIFFMIVEMVLLFLIVDKFEVVIGGMLFKRELVIFIWVLVDNIFFIVCEVLVVIFKFRFRCFVKRVLVWLFEMVSELMNIGVELRLVDNVLFEVIDWRFLFVVGDGNGVNVVVFFFKIFEDLVIFIILDGFDVIFLWFEFFIYVFDDLDFDKSRIVCWFVMMFIFFVLDFDGEIKILNDWVVDGELLLDMLELIDDVCEFVVWVLFEDILIIVVEDMFFGIEICVLVIIGVMLIDDVILVVRVLFVVGVICKLFIEVVDVLGLDGLDWE